MPIYADPVLEFTLSALLNKETYMVNEPIYLTVRFTRNSGLPPKEIRQPVLDPNSGGLRIHFQNPDGSRVLYKRGEFSRTAFGSEARMHGGEQIQAQFLMTWNSETGNFVTNSPGRYSIWVEVDFEDLKTEVLSFEVIEPSSELKAVSNAFSMLEVTRSLDTRHPYPIKDSKLRSEIFDFIGPTVDNIYDSYLAAYFIACEAEMDSGEDLNRAEDILNSTLAFVPDNFPLLPELLYHGSRICYEKGNRQRALAPKQAKLYSLVRDEALSMQ